METRGKEYRLFQIVHISKRKLVRKFPDRPDNELEVDQADRVDFDRCLLPKTAGYENWKRVNTRSRRSWRSALVRRHVMGDSNEFSFVGRGLGTLHGYMNLL